LENDAEERGEEWIFVICRTSTCGRPLLLSPISRDMLDENGDLTLRSGDIVAACEHCQAKSPYRPEELRRGRARQKQ
jgi:hypothetical protein